MSISLNSNIAALRAQRRLNEGSETLSRIYERLSSGQRINRASDDAAGLAITLSLQTDARLYSQAVRNGNDGISLLSIADGAVSELSNIVTRISELAEQSANGVYATAQRAALNNEAQALAQEYSRIVDTTSFNGTKLLDGTAPVLQMQIGTTSASSSRIEVAFGRELGHTAGDGTFDAATTLFALGGNNPSQVAAKDVNGDGRDDVVVMTWLGARVLLNNGNGTFSSSPTYVTGNQTKSLAMGDLNGDGAVDLVTRSEATTTYLFMLLGNGNGSFKAAQSVAMDNSGTQVALRLADINGDGATDLLSATGSDVLSIRLGNGDGTFQAITTLAISRFFNTADVNQDEKNDLIAIDFGVSLGTYLGNGNGTFQARIGGPATGNQVTPSILDLNGDGFLDLIMSASNFGSFSVSLGNGNGTFTAPVSYTTVAALVSSAMAFTDVNYDGTLDAVSLHDDLYVQLGNGNGSFKGPVSYGAGSTSGSNIAVADLNGDGALDVVTSDSSTDSLYLVSGHTNTSYDLQSFSLLSAQSSRATLDTMSEAQQRLASARGTIGSLLRRIEVAISNDQVSAENALSAAARIFDADVAEESAGLTKAQILQQAASAVLAQANQQPTLALQLLRGG